MQSFYRRIEAHWFTQRPKSSSLIYQKTQALFPKAAWTCFRYLFTNPI